MKDDLMTAPDKRAAIFRWRSALQKSDVPFDVRSTLWMLAQYADNNTLVCWPGQKALMEDNNLSKSALNRKLEKALLSGWLVREERGGQIKGKNTEYRLRFGPTRNCVPEAGHEETVNENWVPDMENWVPLMNDLGPANGTPTTHELLVNNYSSIDIRSTDVDHGIKTQNRTQAQEEKALTDSVLAGFQESKNSSFFRRGPLPAGWHPNGAHVEAAKRWGFKATALGKVFEAWAVGEGRMSGDWDKDFGWVIKSYGENDTASPEDHGMAGLGDYSAHPDDPEWFLCDEYRWTPPATAPAAVSASVSLSPEWVPNAESRERVENLGHDADVILERLREECLGNPAVKAEDWDDAYRKLALRVHGTTTSKVKWVEDRRAEWATTVAAGEAWRASLATAPA